MHTQLLAALGTLLLGLGERRPSTHFHLHSHTNTQGCLFSVTDPWKWPEVKWAKVPGALKILLKDRAEEHLPSSTLKLPQHLLYDTSLPGPNLVFPQRWHMYQWGQEMSWVGGEQLCDRCHLQSVQTCFWCVNYSINQHIALSGCQHLITSETLTVNGVKYVSVDDRSHIMLLFRVFPTLSHFGIQMVVSGMCMCLCDIEGHRVPLYPQSPLSWLPFPGVLRDTTRNIPFALSSE